MATRVKTISVGEVFVLPPGASITSIGTEGDISLSSTCADVQAKIDSAEEYLCYRFTYSHDIESGNNIGDSVELRNLIVGTTLYPLNVDGDAYTPSELADQLSPKFPEGIVTFTSVSSSSPLDDSTKIMINVKMIPSIAAISSIYIVMDGFGGADDTDGGNGLYIKPELITCP